MRNNNASKMNALVERDQQVQEQMCKIEELIHNPQYNELVIIKLPRYLRRDGK